MDFGPKSVKGKLIDWLRNHRNGPLRVGLISNLSVHFLFR